MSEESTESVKVSLGDLKVEVSGSDGKEVEDRFNRVVDRMLQEASESKDAIRTIDRSCA